MNRSKFLKRFLCILLCGALVLSLSGCTKTADSGNDVPNKQIQADEPTPDPAEEVDDPTRYFDQHEAVTDAALSLLLKLYENGRSRLISPMSIYYALAMLANGAEGDTLTELEGFMGLDRNALNYFLYSYYDQLVDGETMHIANSVWIRNNPSLMINDSFLTLNQDWLFSETHTWDDDQEGVKAINGWVNENTDGMIPAILDLIPEEAQLYLINAICFEMDWLSPFTASSVHDGEFTDYAGNVYDVEYMHGNSYEYLDFGNAYGIMRAYENMNYSFVAILPNEDLPTFLASLDASSFADAMQNIKRAEVSYNLPKFSVNDSMELSEILKLFGVETVFDPDNADLSGIGAFLDGNLFVSRILHKTYIEVGEQGTRAGAVTAIETSGTTAFMGDRLELDFDVPFLYMIIDTTTYTPLFIGTFECPEA